MPKTRSPSPRRSPAARRRAARRAAAARRSPAARPAVRRAAAARRAAIARIASYIRGGARETIVIKVSPTGKRVPYTEPEMRERIIPFDEGWYGKWSVYDAHLARMLNLEVPAGYVGAVFLPEREYYDVVYENFAGKRVRDPLSPF